MTTALEISTRIETLIRLSEEGGEVDYDSMLEVAEKEFSEKLTAYSYALSAMKTNAAMLSERAELLKRKAKAFEKAEKRMKDYIKFVLEKNPNVVAVSSEKDKFVICKTPESLDLDLITSTRSVSNVLDFGVEGIPSEFIDVVTFHCINKDAVKKHLQAGNKLDWAELKQDTYVRIY